MHVELLEHGPLICPACRRITERGRELWTLALGETTQVGATPDEIVQGFLRCENLACQRSYPIVDGIPIVMLDPAAFLAAQPTALNAELAPQTLAQFVVSGSDDAPLARLLEHLSIYLDAHFGDRSLPPPDGPLPGWGGQALFSALDRLAAAPAGRVVELGCSVGRGLFMLQPRAQMTIGIDLHFGALRAARRVLSGEPFSYARRVIGRHYQPVRIEPLAAARVHLVCADALDPPLAPQAFDRVVALNLLDSVRSPRQLLSVIDGLCAPGGEIALASPYSWQSGIVEEGERLGGTNPREELRRIFAQGDGLEAAYAILADLELPWQLRRDARTAHSYLLHTLHARKTGG